MRTVAAAFDLFTDQGVSGTSLQMIADAVGVTKAAIYYQFKTKDEIVLAVAETELERLERRRGRRGRRLRRPSAGGAPHPGDRALGPTPKHGEPPPVRPRDGPAPRDAPTVPATDGSSVRGLVGDDPSPESRVQTAMISAALAGAVVHPLVMDLDDDTLESQLLHLARRLFERPRGR